MGDMVDVTVLFDESHGEAWSIRPEIAATLRPERPADASLARAADLTRGEGFVVTAHVDGPLSAEALASAAVLVIAHPSDGRFERTLGGLPVFAASEIDAIVAFVENGGGLVLLGETEQAKYGSNLGELASRFGVDIQNDTVYDYEAHHAVASWVRAEPGDPSTSGLLARVADACFYRAGTLALRNGAQMIARTSDSAAPSNAPLAAAVEHGAGRVVVLADSDLFGDDCIGEYDHESLWRNLITWVAIPACRAEAPPVSSPIVSDPAWAELKRATDALRLIQLADGSADAAQARPLVERMRAAIAALAPRVPHNADYLAAVRDELEAWIEGGCERPDFTRSLDLFRPDLHRVDGIEHLVVLPMYKQNGPRETQFEALVIRVPWPEWLAQIERSGHDNRAFLPATFMDRTAGYDSECAVLFPETVSIAGVPANNFGAIFCDREAERMQRVASEAVTLLRLNLPPDAERLLVSATTAQAAFALWDLVHDRTHSHGDLPFDPFMIRQRMPFWMYSLEELRCDLTAFAAAVELELGGLALARNVQTAILFDRLFRFPISGTRVRNYDGLGGQLMFAYLHRHRFLSWTDNRLTIDWKRVAEGVQGLRAEVEELYHGGIDKSRIAHWLSAHQLVARYVTPHVASRYVDGAPSLLTETQPKAWVDAVLDDEFPLSIFYTSLREKLAPSEPVVVTA